MQKKTPRKAISLFVIAILLLSILPVSLAAEIVSEETVLIPPDESGVMVTYSEYGGNVTMEEGKTATVSAGVSGTVTWSSTNTTVATVSSTGVISGIRAGTATVTASVNGVVQKRFQVYVHLKNGVYWIGSANPNLFLSADAESISDGTPVELHSLYSGLPNNLLQLWKIYYLGSGLYSVRPMHKLNMALDVTDEAVDIWTAGTTDNFSMVPSTSQWYIFYDIDGYVFVYDEGGIALTYASTAGEGSPLYCADYVETDATFRWTVTEMPLSRNGVVFFDTNNNELCMTPTFYPELGQTTTLANLGYIPSVYSTVSIAQNIAWSSSDTTVATVNSSTGAMTAVKYGKSVASALFAIGSSTYTLEYDIRVCEVEVNLQVVYDDAYSERYSDEYQRVCNHIDSLKSYYLDNFGLYIESTTPQAFESYADECDSPKDEYCECGSSKCEDSGISSVDDTLELKEFHHKNLSNILYRITPPTPVKTFKIAYIGHVVCTIYKGGCTSYSLGAYGLYGLASPHLRLAAIANLESLESELRTSIHEFGHLFGAPDHYGGDDCLNTDQMNSLMGSTRFSSYCIYGESKNDTTVTQSNTICDGCKDFIEDGISSYQ